MAVFGAVQLGRAHVAGSVPGRPRCCATSGGAIFLPEIRLRRVFLRISPYPQKNAFLRITLASIGDPESFCCTHFLSVYFFFDALSELFTRDLDSLGFEMLIAVIQA